MTNFDNSKQLDEFLTSESKRINLNKKNTYKMYFILDLLKRISKLNDSNKLVVKGSIVQLVYLQKLTRSVTDIDLTSSSDDVDSFLTIINAIDSDEGIVKYKNDHVKRTYTGTYKIPVIAKVDGVSEYVGIDYRENNPFIFEVKQKQVPRIFLGDEQFSINVPSLEETLAEKLCIVMECNDENAINTRIKDFYDIYTIYNGEIDLDKLTYYFEKLLVQRSNININMASTKHLSKSFIDRHISQWNEKKEVFEFQNKDINLDGAVYYTKSIIDCELKKMNKVKNKIYSFSIE